ncbi:geranylgeranylglyceryl/heptaprenylglyceryl phosphate synthase [Sulfodiicoccus acidiphilus]|uniref:Geranylgeranylglyceryl phosphate synthase n=2 Tax=Sulfodiicoccus acidiphilus TaxID=1670455 RepID=A0A348B0Q3_9CREN|nr:geranylgeranylglyceryl/heptaprenylglyceryl phosphate synthase [Sulfodiicoccus acidiphilus]GGT86135.1 geranylgeranylglyceryl/heptaprenylglyceryl phosphate synthase [Sulfodiicoccus acidiphilus]
MKGRVNNYIEKLLGEGRTLHFSLIDPDKVDSLDQLGKLIERLYKAGTSGFLVGGTIGVTQSKLEAVLETMEDYEIPKIIFPSNINVLSPLADAVLFMSLLNSDDLYYVVGAQVMGAPLVKQMGLEILPTAYLIIGEGGTAGHVGRVRTIPFDNHELGAAYAMAAEFMGMRYIYLEAGSGSPRTVNPSMVRYVAKLTNLNVIVGGGIRNPEAARSICEAGADIVVTGTLLETDPERAVKVIEAVTEFRTVRESAK